MFNSNRGITLVALVITIIVLLILAGVSISLVVGDNGIMTRAKDAGTKTNEADAVESLKLAVASLTSAYFADEYTGSGAGSASVAEYVKSKISTELANLGYSLATDQTFDVTLTNSADTEKNVKIKKTDADDSTAVTVKYTVTKNGNISNITK